MATLLCLRIVYACVHATKKKKNQPSCYRDRMTRKAKNMYHLGLYSKSWLTPGLDTEWVLSAPTMCQALRLERGKATNKKYSFSKRLEACYSKSRRRDHISALLTLNLFLELSFLIYKAMCGRPTTSHRSMHIKWGNLCKVDMRKETGKETTRRGPRSLILDCFLGIHSKPGRDRKDMLLYNFINQCHFHKFNKNFKN